MVKLRIIDAKAYTVNLKCTIQSQGRLGFTDDTAEELGLKSGDVTAVALANDEEGSLYMLVGKDMGDEAFRVMRAGDYYYLPTRNLFNAMGLDYRNETIMFDLARSKENDTEGTRVYRMIKRVVPKKGTADTAKKKGGGE